MGPTRSSCCRVGRGMREERWEWYLGAGRIKGGAQHSADAAAYVGV